MHSDLFTLLDEHYVKKAKLHTADKPVYELSFENLPLKVCLFCKSEYDCLLWRVEYVFNEAKIDVFVRKVFYQKCYCFDV